jgi:LytTr DNA-binding domain
MRIQLPPFAIKFVSFLLLFSLAMSGLIFWREQWDGYVIAFSAVLVWQLAIWMPWAWGLPLIEWLGEQLEPAQPLKARFLVFMVLVSAVVAHGLWFFEISDRFSPMNSLPNTRFGVYPYFFIFYAMIDAALVWGLSVRLGVTQALGERPPKDKSEIITVKNDGNTHLLQARDIDWVSAEDYYAKIHCGERIFMLRQPLKALLHRLPNTNFVQVHRSTLVRLDYIVRREGRCVVLKDGTKRTVSKAGLKRLRKLLD